MKFSPNPNFKQELYETVRQKLNKAAGNPISESRLKDLNDEATRLGGRSDKEAWDREEQIQNEILESSVVSDNLIEFREVLRQVAEMCGQDEEFVTDLLAHENAHGNVAEATGHDWVGYVAVFIKDEIGRLVSVQPAHFLKSNRKWGKIETILKRIMVTDAPRIYDNALSPGDEEDLKRDRAAIFEMERFDKEKITRIKKELGMNE